MSLHPLKSQLQNCAKNKQGALFAILASPSEQVYFLQEIKPLFENTLMTAVENCEKELFDDLFSTFKLLVVQDVSTALKKQKEKLLKVLSTPSNMCILLCFEKSLDATDKKLVKLCQEKMSLLDEKPWDKTRRYSNMIANQFQKEHIVISQPLLDQIVKAYESDIMTLYQEVEKLICFLGDKKQVTMDDLHSILSTSFETNAWNLGTYFLEKNTTALFRLIDHLAQDEQGLVALIYQIRYQLSQFLEMKSFLNRDNRQDTFRKHFRLISLNRARKIQEGLSQFSIEYLQQRLIKLMEFEYLFKKNPSIQHKTTLSYLLIES